MLTINQDYHTFENIKSQIKALEGNAEKVEKKILKSVATILRNKLRKAFKKIFSVNNETDKDILGVSKKKHIAFVGIAGRKQYKYKPHEYGKEIKPKKKKFLSFKNKEGTFIRVKSVNIQRQPFFFETVERYDYKKDVEKILQREVKKLWNK